MSVQELSRLLNDARLSWGARGLGVWLIENHRLGRPWAPEEVIAAGATPDSLEVVQELFVELDLLGYL